MSEKFKNKKILEKQYTTKLEAVEGKIEFIHQQFASYIDEIQIATDKNDATQLERILKDMCAQNLFRI
jgi:hypothetical protein